MTSEGERRSRWRLGDARQGGGVSLRHVVAYNMREARIERGLTQDTLGQRLGELTEKPWTRGTVSAAEGGWDSTADERRVRHFDVNEVAALAVALEVPLWWFFLPPPVDREGFPVPDQSPWITVRTSGDQPASPVKAMSSEFLSWLVVAQDDHDAEWLQRRLLKARRHAGLPAPTEQRVVVQRLRALLRELEGDEVDI